MKKHLSRLGKTLSLSMILAVLVTLISATFVTPAQATESGEAPQVDLSNIQYGSASFEADGSAAAKASLKTTTGVKIYLNVQAQPMTKSQIKAGTCRTAPIGKKFFNEMVDPATGKHYYKPWRVQAGDNVFCMGKDGVWRKKSCGNKAKGIFGVPKPPKTKIRVSGVVQDYLTWAGELELKSQQSGSAMAHVVQYYEGKQVCEAKASVSGSVLAYVRQSVTVKSRTMLGISLTAANQAEVQAGTSTTVKGVLEGKVRTHLEGEAMAMCNYTPPPPPPPAHDECPDIPGDQPEGYECNPPAQPPVFVQFRQFNDLEVNWTDDHCVTVDTPAGHTATVYWEADFGSFATPQKTAQDGMQICSAYKAPSEVPAGGTDRITVRAVDNVTDLSVTKTTDPFVIHPTAPHPG